MNSDNTVPLIALVVPCYNESAVLPISAPVLLDVLERLYADGKISHNSFILFCNDGSSDNTWLEITKLHAADKRYKAISLAHNRGQQAAIFAGLMTVRDIADAAITIDADLQDSPEVIGDMIDCFIQGYDIVYGVRSSRKSDSWFKRNSARLFYRFQKAMGVELMYDHSEFRLMSRRALELLGQYDESNLYLRGILPHIGLRSTSVSYNRNIRIAGETKYPLRKLISTGIDGITSFTAKPVRIIFTVGLALLILDIAVAVWVFISHFGGRAISGWSSLMLSIWFLGSLILIALGIIGEYICKIFVEVKRRPRYAIMDTLL